MWAELDLIPPLAKLKIQPLGLYPGELSLTGLVGIRVVGYTRSGPKKSPLLGTQFTPLLLPGRRLLAVEALTNE